MKRGLLLSCTAVIGALGLYDGTARAGVTPMTYQFTYQGRLDIAGAPFTGTAQMRFTLWDSAVGGAIAPPPAPADNVIPAVSVVDGVFTVTLNFGASAFVGDQRFVNVEVDTTAPYGDAYTALTPRQLVTATPYAAFALGVNGATITNLNASNIATGTIANARTTGNAANVANTLVLRNAAGGFNAGPIVSTLFTGDGSGLTNLSAASIGGILPIANGGTSSGTAAGALSNLTNAQVSVSGSTVDVAGNLNVAASDSVRLSANQISTYGGDGLEQIRLWGAGYGEVLLNDLTDNNTTVRLAAQSNAGGLLQLRDAVGANTLEADGGSGRYEALDGYYVTNTFGGTALGRFVSESMGGRLYTQDEAGLNTTLLGSSTSAGGFIYLYQANGSTLGMDIDGDQSGAGGGAFLSLRNGAGTATFQVDADISSEARMSLNNDLGNNTVFIDTDSVNNGRIILRDRLGLDKVLFGLEGTNPNASGNAYFYNESGAVSIELDGDFGGSGDGRVITDELQITGGSDLSEQFDIAGDGADLKPEPGMVVCIDPDRPGELLVSAKAYDRCVAGIISGANGIKPGLLMGQKSTEADGRHPVALTGRVYVRVTEANGSIEPGDLLTSSDEPGNAMKVTDFAKAQGAIIGKAMTRVNDNGMVLVLVGLQ